LIEQVKVSAYIFASAMTLLGHTGGTNYSSGVSYLDLTEFIMQNGARPDADLEELWRSQDLSSMTYENPTLS